MFDNNTCKKKALDLRTLKYIDIIINTICLFLKRIKKINKDLLRNDIFKQAIKEFTDAISSLYYFAGNKYNGHRLCNIFSPLIKNINTIFEYEMIIQTGKDGLEMCGHGITHLTQKHTGNTVVVVHIGNESTGDVDMTGLNDYTIQMKGGNTLRKKKRIGILDEENCYEMLGLYRL